MRQIPIDQNGTKQGNPAAAPEFPGEFPGCGIARGLRGNLDAEADFPLNCAGDFPGRRTPQSSSQLPGDPPGVSREVGRGVRFPGEFPGKSVAPDSGSGPWELISIRPGIPARRRRPGRPNPTWRPLSRLDANPAFPRTGAGISGPRERYDSPRYRNSPV